LNRPSRPQAPHRVDSAHYITGRVRGVPLADIRKRVRITQNGKRFLESVLVSGDKHLLGLQEGLPIPQPTESLRELSPPG
jgi:hypothetical protein